MAALVAKGVITKGEDGLFRPNGVVTRAELAKMLTKAFDLGEGPLVNNPFQDVDSGKWYANFIQPLLKYNITKGTSATTFGPEEVVTRGQIVTFIIRCEEAKK